MSHFKCSALGKIASSQSNLINASIQKYGAGLGTFSNLSRPVWEPIGKDRWSSKDNEIANGKTMSTVAYAKKLQCEEELRSQTKAFHVPMSQIMKELRKKPRWNNRIINEL